MVNDVGVQFQWDIVFSHIYIFFNNPHYCRNNLMLFFFFNPGSSRSQCGTLHASSSLVDAAKHPRPQNDETIAASHSVFHLFGMFEPSLKRTHASSESSSWTWFHSTVCICTVCGVSQGLLGKLLTPDTCVAVESVQIRTTEQRISYRFAYCTFLTSRAFETSASF